MLTSRIPAAIDGLLALCTGQTGPGGLLDGVAVFDGPPVKGATAGAELLLYIADTPDGDGPGTTGNQDFAALGRGGRDETFSIYCTAAARSGDTDIRTERNRAFALVAAVETLLRPHEPGADATLGGAVLWSSVGGEESYTPIQDDDGAYVEVGFNIVCRARI